MLNRQLGLACLDLVALLTHTFCRYLVALVLLLLLVGLAALQMSRDESRCELILSNGRSQQFGYSFT